MRVTPSGDGSYATVVVGFTEDNPNTGTQLSWSTDRNAWYSTDQPETFDAPWKDASSQSASWGGTATIYLSGLRKGVTYYLKARRYLTAGGTTTYSAWSKLASVETVADTAANDRCGFVSLETGTDGLSAVAVVGWTEDTPNTGTELTWSDREDEPARVHLPRNLLGVALVRPLELDASAALDP